jgi:hypothetical protein
MRYAYVVVVSFDGDIGAAASRKLQPAMRGRISAGAGRPRKSHVTQQHWDAYLCAFATILTR